MKVFYSSNIGSNATKSILQKSPDLLLLSPNNWDDFGFRTTLRCGLYFNGQELEFDMTIKILIEGVGDTASKLTELKKLGWDGFFPIPSVNYISIPNDIDFYNVIVSKLGSVESRQFLSELRDAGFLINVLNDDKATKLSKDDSFKISLLRESGFIKAFQDGWTFFKGTVHNEIQDFDLRLLTRSNAVRSVPFKFESDLLPYDINVIIGPNGIGKSYCLKSLVEYWLQTGIGEPEFLKKINHQPFNVIPNISKLILVSYSPFEDFSLDLEDEYLQDKQAYKYFGFRYAREDKTIAINRNLPAQNSAESIIKAINDDNRFEFIQNRTRKFESIKNVLLKAFEFDEIVLEVGADGIPDDTGLNKLIIEGTEYVPINPLLGLWCSTKELIEIFVLSSGVLFVKNNKIVKLSSGQRLFTYIVINVVGELKENSLVVIDEPELFLHPTLEIEFILLLKSILKPFKSKAILATHSLAVVREVPLKCVHIFRDEGEGLDIVEPPFQTFGGDMQRISTYVFGDKSVTKPFDEWLQNIVQEHSAEQVIEKLGSDINEELMMKLLRLGKNNDN